GGTAKADIVLTEDKTPPVASELKIEGVYGVSAAVLWKTDEACRSIVRYGTSSRGYKKMAESTSYVKSHRIVLTGLANNTKYYFVVESTDGAGNCTKGKERNFTTRKVKHPFLIVKKADYVALRARAAKSPWKQMKADAISYMKSHNYTSTKDVFVGKKYSSMAGIARAGALAYILDPDNKTYYRKKITDALSHWDKLFAEARDWTGHNGQYYLNADWQAAFFNSVLALDVIYDDLPESKRADIEAKLDKVADWYHRKSLSSYHSANYGLWALYRNDRRRIDSAKTKWRSNYTGWFSSDGVFFDGPGYAICSANSRHGKMHFHHILEFTGEDKTWYSDPRIDGFYEWLYGAGFSPFRRMIGFGDTGPNRAYDPFDPGVHKFSMQAFRNLAWCANGRTPSGGLFHYALMDKPLPKPKKPLSRIWPDGCAAFWENNPSDRSLMGVLWNCKNTRHGGDGHSHKEVNALHLCAYGEHVLRNSGYVGWGNGALGFSWNYVHHTAVSANTVLIDGKDHVAKKGSGIIAGFTAPRFDYADGYSKNALPNGKHRRNFCFVHPQDGRGGYWVLFDEVDADKPSSKVNVALHPNS
ncbi:MAG: fibronectin type III domain-containing protein, partial [Phycisphaerae bacterium]|nr:fibronectin type III domain-containing protein [Phycisphaerae bacterium]